MNTASEVGEYDWIARAQARRYRGYVGGAIEFDDLVQEARLGIVRGLRRYRADAGASRNTWVSKWASAFVRRHIERHRNGVFAPTGKGGIRRRGQIVIVPTCDVDDAWWLGAEDASTREHRLGAAFAALPERWRHLLTERYAADRTLQSLANESGCTKQGIQNVIRRALGRLRQDLETSNA